VVLTPPQLFSTDFPLDRCVEREMLGFGLIFFYIENGKKTPTSLGGRGSNRNEIFPKKMVDITNPMGYYIGKIWKKGGGQA